MYHAVGSQSDDARAEGAEDSKRPELDTDTDNARRENCLVKPDGNVNTPDSSLTRTFEKSKQNRLIANCATVSHTKVKKRRGKKQTLKTMFEEIESTASEPSAETAKEDSTTLEDIGLRALEECAIENYCRFHGLPKGCATLAQVENTSAKMLGWAAYIGPGLHDFMTPPISSSESWQVIQNRKKQRKMAKKFAFYNTDEGQKELVSMDADRTSRTREALGLSTLTEHASTGRISPMGNRN